MPGFDGTGPQGYGSFTGGGRGYCALPADNLGQRIFGRQFFGRGRGQGRGLGRGFGRGLRWRAAGYAYNNPYFADPYVSRLTPQQEVVELKAEAKAMQEEISSINQRIKELAVNSGSSDNE